MLLLALIGTSLAGELPPCQEPAVGLLRYTVDGLRAFQALESPDAFAFWLDCEEPDFAMPTAVHESVHLLSGRVGDGRYAFYVLGGKQVFVPVAESPPRKVVVGLLRPEERDGYVDVYLSGPSGDQGLELLLDELNAYVYGLSVRTSLAEAGRLGNRRVTGRDGVAHFQLYLGLYLKHLRVTEPERHAALGKTHGDAVSRIWKLAERELKRSEAYPGLGIDDRWYLARAWDEALLEELDRFVGARVWSSSMQKRYTTDPPAGPTPPPRGQARRSDQRQVRASVHVGEDVYEYQETSVPGSVVLSRNGERLDVRTWEQLQALGLPEVVQKALSEARKPLTAP